MVVLRRITRRVWFRAALMTLGGILLALLAGLLGAWITAPMSIDLGQGSVSTLLQIIASSMLAVSTFSLTIMVTAYSSAATSGTPRATQLLIEDRTSQNVLSLFIGSFTFALVGIVALSTGYYDEEGRTVLFLGTLAVIVLIVIALLRWINHLAHFGRVADTIDRVEQAALEVVCEYAERPTMGGVPLRRLPRRPLRAVHGSRVGYVTQLDMTKLQSAAESAETDVYVVATPGRQADVVVPLAYVPAESPEDVDEAVRQAFLVDDHRTFESDPRLGVIALSEIGIRALSSAVNDPGTAIEVIAALERVFAAMADAEPRQGPDYDRVHVREVQLADLVTDAFRPLARDGAGFVEVHLRLQRTLGALAALAGPAWARPFRAAAADADRRAAAGLDRADRRALRRARRDSW